ncbi:polar amino acid transport system substrate-binding protein [Actinoplanes campanulatus]|uniref:Polar amino acid transport system substrate-binding protein n=1 Tax=Actinoplanes campanulatus TaxID=113559 RepID=A0A7W5FJB1_9ACTN|nr:ABC transporter substrate-binding protein [Actinoplanes campanulatus]MBB3100583.1 polar amino acid transport system substrate-binding protein [Actinoplanes campanulatus]GGN45044.1 amino acid ABC transporter substrate-binding protein [Actinoplanes campanulatus]GID40985.1 amino acid ABC transporter substrate-binding protein [Actinoplanes campanulatus]
MLSRHTPVALGGAALLLAAVTACSPVEENDSATATSPSAAVEPCAPASLATKTAGKLTVGTDNPAYEPWFSENKPDNGKGYESAVAYQVAERLGYQKSDVVWTGVTFNNAIAPGPKAFDIDVNQFSITDERRAAVDFSSPYYLVRQTVITTRKSKIAGAKSLADLKDAELGAQVGTTSYQAITDVIKPTAGPAVFNNNDDAKKALENGTVDGIVVDLPTAFYMTAAELEDGVIVGQLPQVGVPEQFGIVLDKGSPLTGCVSRAVDQLRQDGTLAVLEKTWLAGSTGAPELQ